MLVKILCPMCHYPLEYTILIRENGTPEWESKVYCPSDGCLFSQKPRHLKEPMGFSTNAAVYIERKISEEVKRALEWRERASTG